jgi:hypothetical protein
MEANGGFMDGLKKLAGVYMVGVAVVVAVYFIVNNFLAGSFDLLRVWHVLDVLMLIGLALALIFNYASMREEGGSGEAVTRRYLEVNTAFFVTAGVMILFLHNWLSLLALGPDMALGPNSLNGNHQAWIIWAAVDTLLPLVLGVTGCRVWRESSGA